MFLFYWGSLRKVQWAGKLEKLSVKLVAKYFFDLYLGQGCETQLLEGHCPKELNIPDSANQSLYKG